MSDPLTNDEQTFLIISLTQAARTLSLNTQNAWHTIIIIARKLGIEHKLNHMKATIHSEEEFLSAYLSSIAPDPSSKPTGSPPPNG